MSEESSTVNRLIRIEYDLYGTDRNGGLVKDMKDLRTEIKDLTTFQTKQLASSGMIMGAILLIGGPLLTAIFLKYIH